MQDFFKNANLEVYMIKILEYHFIRLFFDVSYRPNWVFLDAVLRDPLNVYNESVQITHQSAMILQGL